MIETIEETLKVTITSNSRRPISDSRDKKYQLRSQKVTFLRFFGTNTLLEGTLKNAEKASSTEMLLNAVKDIEIGFHARGH